MNRKKAGGLTEIYETGDSNEKSAVLRCHIKSCLQALDGQQGFSIVKDPYHHKSKPENSRLYLCHESLPWVRFKLLSYNSRQTPYYQKFAPETLPSEQLNLLEEIVQSFPQSMIVNVFVHFNKEENEGFFFWVWDKQGKKQKTTKKMLIRMIETENNAFISKPQLPHIEFLQPSAPVELDVSGWL
jgi:hypothetical protein